MDARTRQLVRERAGHRCEYCRLPDVADELPFHVDHIIARVHGGSDDFGNLSWSCTQCNLHKASNFASVDPNSGKPVSLFDPRNDHWDEHFAIELDSRIIGRTASGRATARLLDMNGSPQIDLRRELMQRGDYQLD
jgi:hypothetical protein